MDKFGVFNILSSLLSKTQQDVPTNSNDSATSTMEKTQQSTNPLTPPLPLQVGMINTMTSHDELIKRVKQKHKNLI